MLTGTLEPGLELVNARARARATVWLTCICDVRRDMTEVGHAYAGDIIVAPKLAAETGDTLSITGKVEAAAFSSPTRSTALPSRPRTVATKRSSIRLSRRRARLIRP